MLRVALDRSVLMSNGIALPPGAEVPEGEFTADRIEALLRKGFLVDGDAPEIEEQEGRGLDVTPSKWSLNPADLEGKDLDELNVMVLERDETVDPFETVEEAVAWLSQDFEV